MKCENCGIEHNGSYGSGRFCCLKCARGFSTKNKRQEINEKVSKKLAGRKLSEERKLKTSGANNGMYGKEPPNKGKKVPLSIKLKISNSLKGRKLSEEQKKKQSITMKKKWKDGKLKGWKTRKKLEPSYPEKFFIKVLNNNNIIFEREKKVGKYFIDFAINDRLIALEIDGKQHNNIERKKADKAKDKYLKKLGWKVYRIPWKEIKSDIGKLYIKNEIEKFLNFYNNIH